MNAIPDLQPKVHLAIFSHTIENHSSERRKLESGGLSVFMAISLHESPSQHGFKSFNMTTGEIGAMESMICCFCQSYGAATAGNNTVILSVVERLRSRWNSPGRWQVRVPSSMPKLGKVRGS